MDPVERMQYLYKKERNRQLSAGFIIILSCIILIIIPYEITFITGVSVSLVGFIFILFNLLRAPSYNHPVFLAIKYNPQKITHFYLKEFKREIRLWFIPLGEKKETRLMVRIDNKRTFNMPVKEEWYQIREYMKRKCPHAAYHL